MRERRMAACCAACAMALAACRVGPKYHVPSAPVPAAPAYKEAAPPAYQKAYGEVAGTWHPAKPSDAMLKGKWWEIFGEPELNGLEEQLNINNQNIAQFFQNFMAARALVREARAAYFPVITVTPSANVSRAGGGSVGSTVATTPGTGTATSTTVGGAGSRIFTNFTLPFEASWAPDVFGRVQNQVREARYAAQVSAADLENERLLEQASLAVYYFELRGQDWLQDIYNKTIEADRETLKLTQTLVATGVDSPQALAQAELALREAEAQGAGVGTNRAIFEHAIATLIGKPASDFSLPVKSLTARAPAIPIGMPSELLERRPDIAAAERTMAEANAAIGVEYAAYYPSFNLTASGGFTASKLSTLFSLPSLFWSVGSSAQEIIFNGGLRGATIAQLKANYNADVALYRQTVLTAFQQVEDYLATVRITSTQIVLQEQAVKSAEVYLQMAVTRFRAGIDPYLNVLTAQVALLSDQEALVGMRVSEMVGAVNLIQSLGGGWDRTQLPSAKDVTSKTTEQRLAPGAGK